MKQPEPKNTVWESPGSTLAVALVDRCDVRFAAVAGLSMAIDLLVFRILFALGANIDLSQVTSFFAGAMLSFTLNANGGAAVLKPSRIQWELRGRFLLVAILTLLLRSAVVMLLVDNWHWQPQTAILAVILMAAVVFQVSAVFFIYLRSDANESPAVRWPVITISVIAYVFLLKLVFMACINLIPEEAYYWNYAQHLDWGYLDHPPMVAWLIRLSTDVLGKSEFSVRLPAYICWIVAAIFMFRLTLNLYDRPAAFRTVLLLAVLPIYFGLGFFMTPDAPLCAAWAGCLYFLERALIAQDRHAWWGVGVCMGLGLLSKYTIALLGLGALTFVLIDRQSRRWLFRPEPYVAAITSLMLFSPVIFWNMRNGWMSFVFQSSNRWSGRYDFSLHLLIGTILLFLTPTGLLGIFRILSPQKSGGQDNAQARLRRRQHLWSITFTLAPLSIFIIYSLLFKPKLNWTAPVWLAAMPLLAREMVPLRGQVEGSFTRLLQRSWMPTIIALLIIHGSVFYYISMGLPGAGPMTAGRLFGEWRVLANEVETIKNRIELETGTKPVIVGLDKNFVSSELSFYDSDGPQNTGGAHFFDNRSLMWAFWFPRSGAIGRNVLMVDLDPERVDDPALPQYFRQISQVFAEPLRKDGRLVGYFYWRVGYDYLG